MTARTVTPCLDGGRHHAWQSTGLDVTDDDALAWTARCVWCDVTAERPYALGQFANGVRMRA